MCGTPTALLHYPGARQDTPRPSCVCFSYGGSERPWCLSGVFPPQGTLVAPPRYSFWRPPKAGGNRASGGKTISMLDIEVLHGNPSLPAVAARDFYCLVETYLFLFSSFRRLDISWIGGGGLYVGVHFLILEWIFLTCTGWKGFYDAHGASAWIRIFWEEGTKVVF